MALALVGVLGLDACAVRGRTIALLEGQFGEAGAWDYALLGAVEAFAEGLWGLR